MFEIVCKPLNLHIKRLHIAFQDAKDIILDDVLDYDYRDINPVRNMVLTLKESVQSDIAEQLYCLCIDRAIRELRKNRIIAEETLSELNRVLSSDVNTLIGNFNQASDSNVDVLKDVDNEFQEIYHERFVKEITEILNSKPYKKVMGANPSPSSNTNHHP